MCHVSGDFKHVSLTYSQDDQICQESKFTDRLTDYIILLAKTTVLKFGSPSCLRFETLVYMISSQSVTDGVSKSKLV